MYKIAFKQKQPTTKTMVLPQLLDNQVFFFFLFQESAVELDFPCFKLAFRGCLFRSRVGFAFFLCLWDSPGGELGQISTMLCWQWESRPPGPQEDGSQPILLKENWKTGP